MKKRILCLALTVLMLLTSVLGMVACTGTPTTPPVTQTCTNHTDANHDNKCDSCAAAVNSQHVDANHDGTCDTPTCNKKGLTVVHDDADENYVCDTCDAVIEHDCVDDELPWGKCDLCGEDFTSEHTCVDNGTGVCGICFQPIEIPECEQCTDAADSNGECDVCHRPTNCECVDEDPVDEFCDLCGAYVPAEEDETVEYPWEKTTLRVQLTENTNSQEILSVSRKYLAGDFDGADTIAEAARTRNLKAANASKVAIFYSYYPDTKEYNWGQNIERITQTNNSGTDVPDIYTNFVYDMVGASLKNNFANLLANNISATRGANYFEFLKADYNAEADDEGFMYTYMESLTLAPAKKMYVLSSDYFIDMVRAFFCIPVSVKLMEDYGATVLAQDAEGNVVYEGGDRDGSGAYNFDDFYKLVTDGDWTYDVLAKFSASVWKPSASNQGGCVLGDDIVGFAMAAGGLAASGLLYTTSVEMITKTKNTDGTYSYDYPSDNKDFYAFCDATTKLFGQSQGIVYVKDGYSTFGDSSLLGIRARFTQNKVLFGDIMLVGALEFSEYQNMKTSGGFGIVPVPLYRSGSDDTYLTQVHNIGVCGAISIVTENFSQCTAFLNAQSTTSDEILNNYYEYKLQYDLGQGSKGTVEMLKYIRANVRSSFDKAMEDALYVFNKGESGTGEENRWHSILAKYGFQVDIRDEYAGKYNAKETLLDALAVAFEGYRD